MTQRQWHTGLYVYGYALLVALLCQSGYDQLYAQAAAEPDTTLHLPDVIISTLRIEPDPIGERHIQWPDTLLDTYSGRSLDALLSREAGAFMKSYGAGGISTVSLRGGNASQVAVLWNGVQLANPMVGLQDFSLIPAVAIDNVGLILGGASSLAGSGGIAGAIQLNSSNEVPAGLSADILTTLGSFGLWDQSAKVGYGNRKAGGSTTWFHTLANNEFSFQPSPGKPEQTLTNAATRRFGILQDLFFRVNERDMITAHIWWQEFDREIPPTTVQNTSDASQNDQTFRSMIEWQRKDKVLTYNIKASFLRDEITYEDPQTLTYANSIATTGMAEVAATWSIDPTQSIQLGLNHYRLTGDIDSYEQKQVQNRTALFLRQRQQYRNWAIRIDIRQEIVDGKFSPFVANIGFDYDPLSWMSVHGKVSRDYRLPGINDLYWIPGGDPNLKPERGWSEELGLTFHHISGSHSVEFDITGYNRNIRDWIMWGIVPGENFWSANNLTRVHSRGLDQTLKYRFDSHKLSLELLTGYHFAASTNEVALSSPMIGKGEQLAYVPRHTFNSSLLVSYSGFTLKYYQSFTGEVSSERGDILDNYTTGDFRLSYVLGFRRISIIPFCEILNIWDVDYRVIQFRPMPGHNFRIGLQFKFD